MATATKAIKLTKTQREVLERAARKASGRVGVHAWSQHVGAPFSGKEKGGGRRELAAMLRLVEMGLMGGLVIDHHHDQPRYDNRGWTIYSTEAAATITEAGREAIR